MSDDDFGDDWDPPQVAADVVALYLKTAPEQGDWHWEDHCEGVAGGILHSLHKHGWDVVEVDLDAFWRMMVEFGDYCRRNPSVTGSLLADEGTDRLLKVLGLSTDA